MSSITVQVIFMGLIGFVPNEGGQNGMTALMVDPKGKHEHVPYIFLLDGECASDDTTCFRDCDPKLGKDNPTDPKLCWKLTQEDLKILGDQALLTFDQTGYRTIFGNPQEVPRWKWQANDYSWVPGMELLTGGYGKVHDSCLADGKPCALVRARMRLRGGHATACHLIHKNTEAKGKKREVFLFPYQGSTEVSQAVADAVRVEFQIEGSEIYLHSWSFCKGRQEPHKDSVTLKPSGKSRKLTLVVTNFPDREEDTPQDNESNFHAEILFDLLALQPPVRPTRTDCDKECCETFLRYPGSCEKEADRIKDLFEAAGKKDYIHSRTFCDGMGFQ